MTTQTESVRITDPETPSQSSILTPQAIEFLIALHTRFEPVRQQRLKERVERQARLDAGEKPQFLQSTTPIREGAWTVAPIPSDLWDRRVEITGPPDRKMIINALNSGASVFMADFEDSNSPTWPNCIEGQRNLYDAVRRTIEFTSPEGKEYKLVANPAVLFVRPRGWHLPEKHFLVNDTPISGSLFDFGLFFFHNAKEQIARGTGPYFYPPKLEKHEEARLWNDVFVFAQDYLGIPKGTIRATVLIETITASFEMDEILYELRDHSAGLNCGRWDYIFSFIKKFRNHASHVLPDRGEVTMQQPFLRSYVELLIHTCHRRGIHAMGGMAAQIPIRDNPKANDEAMERVRQDKLREVKAGHDGTWVAHPGLVPIAKAIFDEYMPQANQIQPPAQSKSPITADNLLELPKGKITEAGLRRNIDVGLQYLESWLRSNGCVPIYDLMEDAATAEISRSQLWQWIRYNAKMDDGRAITPAMFDQILIGVVQRLKSAETTARSNQYDRAAELFSAMSKGKFEEFLTSVAYEDLA
jgi:malate synthase